MINIKKKNKKIINNKIRDLLSNQKGMALLTTLIFIFILVTFGVALLAMTSNDTKLSALQRDSTKAFYIAEAGIQDATSRLVNGTAFDQDYDENDITWNFDNSSNGFSNTFTIKHRLAGAAVDMNPATDKPYYIINSTGTSGRAKRKIEVVISVRYTSAFAKALIGCNGVTFGSNAKTSSYSSSGVPTDGNDGDVITTVPGAGIILDSNSMINGTVWSTGDLYMDSNAIVYESAYVNGDITMLSVSKIGAADTTEPYTYEATAGGDINIGSGQIYGTVSPGTFPLPVELRPCDPLDIDALFNDNAVPIQGNNDNNDLDPSYFGGTSYFNNSDSDADPDVIVGGKYYLTDFITDADAIVEIHEEVTLYVDGDFFMYGGSEIKLAGGAKLTVYVTGVFKMDSNTEVNNNEDLSNPRMPSKVMVYSNATSSDNNDYKVILDSNTGLRGVVYAPYAAVKVSSNARAYGSIRGSFISMDSNPGFQYDEELGKLISEPDGYSLEYWREII